MKKAAARNPNAKVEITVPLLCTKGLRTIHAELLTEMIWATDCLVKETEMKKRYEPKLFRNLLAQFSLLTQTNLAPQACS